MTEVVVVTEVAVVVEVEVLVEVEVVVLVEDVVVLMEVEDAVEPAEVGVELVEVVEDKARKTTNQVSRTIVCSIVLPPVDITTSLVQRDHKQSQL